MCSHEVLVNGMSCDAKNQTPDLGPVASMQTQSSRTAVSQRNHAETEGRTTPVLVSASQRSNSAACRISEHTAQLGDFVSTLHV